MEATVGQHAVRSVPPMTAPSQPGIWVDPARGVAGIGDRPVPLSPAEIAALTVFAASPGRAISRSELARRMGLRDRSPRRTDSVLSDLRRNLGRPDLFQNVRGRGWLVAEAITALADEASDVIAG